MSLDDTAGAARAAPYRVLARKYRPSRFADLIGQEAMVRTLSNAFDLDRIHQAYLLSGVRGVGKTTTARILARAFNYHQPAGGEQALIDRPTIAMDAIGTHCQAIIESRHVDVVEMDAASHTGIDDIREIIDGARYRPVLARTKVYIIDEVHMLSKAAFNGLLKTLEEPPEHVKFLFATTEIDKVPVTIRSRCQRFDLRRIETPAMVAHLAGICAAEAVAITPEALALIARAAEGSVRDALSLLDQAIAHGAAGDGIDDATVRGMLGLADRGQVIDLFEQVMRGDIAQALGTLKALHDAGADPLAVMSSLADFVHLVTRLKLVPDAAKDPSLTGEERSRGQVFAERLGLAVLTRAWQMILKGLADIKEAPRPLAAADMVLVRLAFAADLPTPDEAIRQLKGLGSQAPTLPGGTAPAAAPSIGSPASGSGGLPASGGAPMAMMGGSGAQPRGATTIASAARAPQVAEPADRPQARLGRLEDVIALALANRDIVLKTALERDVRLVRFEEGRIEFTPVNGASPLLAQTLSRRLAEWTGQRWMVAVATEPAAAATLREQRAAVVEAELKAAREDSLVQQVLATFPGAELVAVRAPEQEAAAPVEEPAPLSGDDEIGYADLDITDDDL